MNWIVRYYAAVTRNHLHDEIVRNMTREEVRQYVYSTLLNNQTFTLTTWKGN